MKWDIDRALASLVGSPESDTTINRVSLYGVELMDQHLGSKTLTAAERERGHITVWCIGLGKLHQRKLLLYARSLHELYLKARRTVRKLSSEELDELGLKMPKRGRPRRGDQPR